MGVGINNIFIYVLWESLARPKFLGGWGFRNIFSFSKALAVSTLWRVLTKEGIWHKIIKGKYLPHSTVFNWFRSESFTQRGASKIWTSLLKSMHVITNWISWKPGSGQHVSLGRDSILGLGASSFLSPQLINALRQKQVWVLAQAWSARDQDSLQDTWINSNALELTGNLALEWEQYTKALKAAGVKLSGNEDEIIWIGGDASGVLSAKNVYLALLSIQNLQVIKGWLLHMWKWNIQEKVKLFLWLAVNNKILTWNILQRRGWNGPGRCSLCKMDVKTPHISS
jgi:hypothetical protein